MTSASQVFDTSRELLVQRYRQGVHVVRSKETEDECAQNRIGNLFDSPLHFYFIDHNLQTVDFNDPNLEALGIGSRKDLIGNHGATFIDKKAGNLLLENDSAVILKGLPKISEESGCRVNDGYFQTLSFKFPWYFEDKIIGLFGCSIKINSEDLSAFSNAMSYFISSQLLSPSALPNEFSFPEFKKPELPFSVRETEVLQHFVRGKTAKQIGEELEISKRTVEKHLESLKFKANCDSKSALIKQYIDYFF